LSKIVGIDIVGLAGTDLTNKAQPEALTPFRPIYKRVAKE
jgi:hypothetical protein